MLELAPKSVDESAEALARCARDELRVAFAGGGTSPPVVAPSVDAVVSTRGMARVLEHAPSDQVVIVEAGVTLAALQEVLRGHGQRLALDAPAPERATIGGLVATGGFGPRRARYGTIRDLIIGVALVRADGVVARGGGKVVKNVAGFDLPKLACGSWGTLGLVASATFRLHPMPEASASVVFAGLAAADVVARVAALRQAQLEPAAAVALRRPNSGDGRFDLAVRFEGFGPGVEEQVARSGGAAIDDGELWPRHDAIRTGGPWRVKVAALPSRLESVKIGGSLAWYATTGVGFASGDLDPKEIEAARAAGVTVVVERAPEGASISAWGPPPQAFTLMQALKDRFDPERRLNPGIFVGGL